MEPLFENVTVYDREMSRHYTTYHFRHRGKTIPVVFIALGVLLLAVGLWQVIAGGVRPFVFIPGIALAGGGLLLISGRASIQTPAAADGQPMTCRTRFFEDRIELAGPQSCGFYRYEQLSPIGEDGEYFFVYTDTTEALVLKKSGFTRGTPEQFREFLRQKMRERK